MDQFFQYDVEGDMLLWFDDSEAFLMNQSDFVKYTDQTIDGFQAKDQSNHKNINKKMIEFLRRNWTPLMITGTEEPVREQGFKHMINERMRREKQKQSYVLLHSMLPPGTKGDYNSIIQMAAKNIEELQRYKEELERRNKEIEAVLEKREDKVVEEAKIKLRIAYPSSGISSSGISSMLEVLNCLKNTGSKTKSIQSTFLAQELSAVLDIETKVEEAAEVEKAVERTLFEVERKLRFHFREG